MQSHYPSVMEWSERDQRFLVFVPDLPGCFADGQTREEAVRNAETVIQEWLETARSLGRPVPVPRAHILAQA